MQSLVRGALFVAAVVNGYFFVLILLTEAVGGSALDYGFLILNGLSAYGCWVAARHLERG